MVHGHSAFYKWYFLVIYLFSFVLIFTTMAYRNSRLNSRVKKGFLPFLCERSFYSDSCCLCSPGVCICHASLLRIFFYSPLYTNRTRAKAHNWLLLWEVSEASSLTSPSERSRPPLPHMLILVIAIASFSSLYDSFPLFLTGNARLHSHLDKLPHPPPQPGIWKLSIPTTYIN